MPLGVRQKRKLFAHGLESGFFGAIARGYLSHGGVILGRAEEMVWNLSHSHVAVVTGLIAQLQSLVDHGCLL